MRTQEELIKIVKNLDVGYVHLQFTDILGVMKNVSIWFKDEKFLISLKRFLVIRVPFLQHDFPGRYCCTRSHCFPGS